MEKRHQLQTALSRSGVTRQCFHKNTSPGRPHRGHVEHLGPSSRQPPHAGRCRPPRGSRAAVAARPTARPPPGLRHGTPEPPPPAGSRRRRRRPVSRPPPQPLGVPLAATSNSPPACRSSIGSGPRPSAREPDPWPGGSPGPRSWASKKWQMEQTGQTGGKLEGGRRSYCQKHARDVPDKLKAGNLQLISDRGHLQDTLLPAPGYSQPYLRGTNAAC